MTPSRHAPYCKHAIRTFAYAFAAVVVLASAPGRAAADPASDKAKEHFRQGQLHYNLNEFREALTEFKAGYREKPDPVFLYNIAQCHRQLGENAEAIRMYRSYVRNAPGAPNRGEVERRIEDLEKIQKEAPPTVLPPAPSPAPSPAPEPPPAPAPSTSATPEPAPPPAEPTPSPRPALNAVPEPAQPDLVATRAPATRDDGLVTKWWFWTGVGAVVATGVVLAFALSGRVEGTPHAETDFPTVRPEFK